MTRRCLFTFHVHPQHVALLVEVLLHERAALVLWNIHVLEDLVELLVHLLDGQLQDEVLDVLHFTVVGFVGGERPGAVGCVRVAVASLGASREKRVEKATRLCAVVFGHFFVFSFIAL